MASSAASERPVPGLVSVIIGAYNCAGYIAQTLDSVLAQQGVSLELVVVDDGSTDDTWAVLQRYGQRIVAVRQANGGVPAARNTGLAQARGEFIALMDHDDLCEPDRLAVQVALLRAQPEVGLCGTEFGAFNDTGPLAERYSAHYYGQCSPQRGGLAARFPRRIAFDASAVTPRAGAASTTVYLGPVYRQVAAGNFVHPPTVMFRASLLPQIGPFDPQLRYMCDWDWLVRASRCCEFAVIDLPLLQYRRSPGQITSERVHPRASLETVRIVEMVHARDPDLVASDPAAARRHLAEAAMDAAYANAELRPRLALGLVARTLLRYRVWHEATRRVLIRALLPGPVLAWLRRRRDGTAAAG